MHGDAAYLELWREEGQRAGRAEPGCSRQKFGSSWRQHLFSSTQSLSLTCLGKTSSTWRRPSQSFAAHGQQLPVTGMNRPQCTLQAARRPPGHLTHLSLNHTLTKLFEPVFHNQTVTFHQWWERVSISHNQLLRTNHDELTKSIVKNCKQMKRVLLQRRRPEVNWLWLTTAVWLAGCEKRVAARRYQRKLCAVTREAWEGRSYCSAIFTVSRFATLIM